jgi:hypothetical protein
MLPGLDAQPEHAESHGGREVAAVSSNAGGQSDSTGVPLNTRLDSFRDGLRSRVLASVSRMLYTILQWKSKQWFWKLAQIQLEIKHQCCGNK